MYCDSGPLDKLKQNNSEFYTAIDSDNYIYPIVNPPTVRIKNFPNKKLTHLVHLSGGMDSTFVMWDHLSKKPKNPLLVHHIQLVTPGSNRLIAEQIAVNNILNWFQETGYKFNYFHSVVHYGDLINMYYPIKLIKDIQITGVFSAIILKSKEYSNINTLLFPWHTGEVQKEESRKGFRVKLLLDALECTKDVKFEFPIEFKNRRHMYEEMPKDLFKLISFCRNPGGDKFIPCGVCHACKSFKKFKLFETFCAVKKG